MQNEQTSALIDMLTEARDFIDRYSDVNDGSYGVPEPNDAMVMVHEINATLEHVASPASSSSVVQGDASGVEREALFRVADALADDLMSLTDEEVLQEAREDGIDVEAEADRIRKSIACNNPCPQPSGETREAFDAGFDAAKLAEGLSEEGRAQIKDAARAEYRPAPVASSDQPEQGGGMEVKAWLYSTVSGEGKALVKPLQYFDGEQVLGIPLTPAEPAEARVRELEAEVQRWFSAYSIAHDQATENGCRATAAEAQLAEAKEAIKQIRLQSEDCLGIRMEMITSIADQTLAALQEAGGDR